MVNNKQLTISGLIELLTNHPNSEVENITYPHSYRGYYDELALERIEGKRSKIELMNDLLLTIGKTFDGYKGGLYTMSENTLVWISDYGCCGDKIVGLDEDGMFITEEYY